MKQIRAQKLSVEAFSPFGMYRDLDAIEPYRRSPPGDSGFYPDLLTIPLATTTRPGICVCMVRKRPLRIPGLEYHNYTGEGIIPLDGDIVIIVGFACKEFNTDGLQAFVIPKGTFVSLNPGVVHGTQFPVEEEWVRVIVILPEHTYVNDCIRQPLEGDAMPEIML